MCYGMHYFTRFLIIIFWTILIFILLYVPELIKMTFPEKRSINIFSWADTFDPIYIAKFEKQHNCKINITYFESNEELLVKLATIKDHGYDIIMPSDYAVQELKAKGMLHKLDKSKLLFLNNIHPMMLGHAYDPDNTYAIPFEWEIFGLGFDKNAFAQKPIINSLALIFDPKYIPGKIAMVNCARDVIMLTAFYLFGNIDRLTQEQLEKVKNLLKSQKKYVEAYVDLKADYFLITKNCAIALCPSSIMWKAMQTYDNLDFIIPKDGNFLSIENIALPVGSKANDLVYEFINYICSKEVIGHNFKVTGFFPAIMDQELFESLDQKAKDVIISFSANRQNIHFSKRMAPELDLQRLWVELKSY